MTYEYFEHTADLGLRVVAAELAELFRDAADGLFSMMVESSHSAGAGSEIAFRLEAGRYDDLLVDWLSELLYTFESKRLVLDTFDVRIEGYLLSATASSHPFDPDAHRVLREVKAITYHGLTVEPTGHGWLAEVIVDI